jgi:hypothetical protein
MSSNSKSLAMRLSLVDKLYDLMGEGVWFERARSERMAELTDTSASLMNTSKADLTRIGVIDVRYVGEPSGKGGRYADWRLAVSRDEAKKRATALWSGPRKTITSAPEPRVEIASEVRTPARLAQDERIAVAIANTEREETRAIAGPETTSPFESLRPMRRSEHAALAEAVRQYATRTQLVTTKLRELEALGIHINPSSVKMDKDPAMEAQSVLLPYINELEGRCAVFEKTVASLQAQVKGADELRTQARQLKAQNERLIAEKVARAS